MNIRNVLIGLVTGILNGLFGSGGGTVFEEEDIGRHSHAGEMAEERFRLRDTGLRVGCASGKDDLFRLKDPVCVSGDLTALEPLHGKGAVVIQLVSQNDEESHGTFLTVWRRGVRIFRTVFPQPRHK